MNDTSYAIELKDERFLVVEDCTEPHLINCVEVLVYDKCNNLVGNVLYSKYALSNIPADDGRWELIAENTIKESR